MIAAKLILSMTTLWNNEMQIKELTVQNFRGFETRSFRFHPRFNLLVGENGTGKTGVLDALSVALGSWLLGLAKYSAACKSRHLIRDEVRLRIIRNRKKGTVRYEHQYPVWVRVKGEVEGHQHEWSRSLESAQGRTTQKYAAELKALAADFGARVIDGSDVTLPLISYYGTGRVWQQPRDLKIRRATGNTKASKSRFEGYRNSHDPRSSATDLFRWFQTQQYISLEEGCTTPELKAVKQAVLGCIEGGTSLRFNVRLADLVVYLDGEDPQPFNNLSDGYRNVIALVGDIAYKAVTLNPHLGSHAPARTPGVVLIDELDLHLHPKWQRRIIDDLKRAFPKIQFICTTHSPFLIQAIDPGELILLQEPVSDQPVQHVNQSLEDIVEEIQGVSVPQRSRRAQQAGKAAEVYFSLLESGAPKKKLKQAEADYRIASELFGDNPAIDALLKLEAIAAAANRD